MRTWDVLSVKKVENNALFQCPLAAASRYILQRKSLSSLHKPRSRLETKKDCWFSIVLYSLIDFHTTQVYISVCRYRGRGGWERGMGEGVREGDGRGIGEKLEPIFSSSILEWYARNALKFLASCLLSYVSETYSSTYILPSHPIHHFLWDSPDLTIYLSIIELKLQDVEVVWLKPIRWSVN